MRPAETTDPTTELLRSELVHRVLPWWQRHGVDEENGGIFTLFDNMGRSTGTDKYTWSQGRWAWLCARLARAADAGTVEADAAEWTEYALQTARFISTHSVLPGGVTAHLLTRKGSPQPVGPGGAVSVSVLSDLFAALGLVGAAGLLEPDQPERRLWIRQARELLDTATTRLEARTAPSEPYPVRPRFRDMAGIMLRLHVAAELHVADPSASSAAAATRAASELVVGPTAMWRADDWWEFRPDDATDRDTLLARHRTPGHLLETAWMFLDAARVIAPVADLVPDWIPDLARHAFRIAWDHADGGLLRYVDHTGGAPTGRLFGDDRYESLVVDTWDTKLWWVHAEAMLAASSLDTAYPTAGFDTWRQMVTDYTFATFPDPDGAEWIQVRDRGGRPLDRVVALPVKDPFHIARALLLCLEHESETTRR